MIKGKPKKTQNTKKSPRQMPENASSDILMRVIHIAEDINSELIAEVIYKLQVMVAVDPISPIHIFINSPGGCAYSSFALYDYLRSLETPIITYVCGIAASGGSIIYMAGDIKVMYPNSVIMCHSVISSMGGKLFGTIIPEAAEVTKIYNQLCEIYGSRSNMPAKEWHKVLKYEDFYIRPEKAIELGICDQYINHCKKVIKVKKGAKNATK